MSTERQPVLLMEVEDSVIKDVICSLGLVDISVVSSFDVDQAKRMALEAKPNLVLARARISGDEQAGVNLARELAGEGLRFPVVALYRQGEKGLIEGHQDLFVSQIGLPVEFPHFTQQVQQILASLESEARADVCQEVGQPTATKAAADVSPSLDDGETEARGRNLLIAYDLQLQVLDRLRQDPRLSSATVPEMVEFVRTITNAVCASFDAGKFIKH